MYVLNLNIQMRNSQYTLLRYLVKYIFHHSHLDQCKNEMQTALMCIR